MVLIGFCEDSNELYSASWGATASRPPPQAHWRHKKNRDTGSPPLSAIPPSGLISYIFFYRNRIILTQCDPIDLVAVTIRRLYNGAKSTGELCLKGIR